MALSWFVPWPSEFLQVAAAASSDKARFEPFDLASKRGRRPIRQDSDVSEKQRDLLLQLPETERAEAGKRGGGLQY